MRYVSTFSGIEAASVAWEPLGWKPAGFSEIDPFASAVLAHRFPGVTNYGDITKHAEWDIGPGAVDLLVGGSPCQAFSVAGLRKGLDDPRGQLTLVYLQLAARLEPEWIVWENVPGVLSADGGRAFGAFLGGLAELGYGFAWRVLDARHFGVPQRRRRVFLVARRAGDWESAAKVLLEPEGMHRNPAARGEAGEAPAGAAADGARAGGVWWDGSDTAATLTRNGSGQRMPDKGNFFGVVQREVGALCAVDRKGANNQYVDQDKLIVLPDVPDEVGCLDLKCGGDHRSNQTAMAGHFIPMGFAESSFANYKANDVTCLRASGGTHGGGSENLVVDAVPFRKSRRAQSAEDHETWVADGTANTLNGFDTGDVRTTHAIAQAADVRTGRLLGDISGTICAKGSGGWSTHMINPVIVPHAFYATGGSHGLEPQPNVCPPLKVGSALGIPSPPAVAYTIDMQGCKGNANVGDGTLSPTLGRPSGTDCHAVVYGIDGEMNASHSIIGPLKRGGQGGRQEAIAYPIDGRNAMRDPDKHDEMNRQGVGVGNAGDPAHTVTTACVHAVAVDVYNQTVDGDCAATVTAAAGGTNTSGPKVQTGMVVRRLTPVECERLQGFPDGWTDIPYRGKPAPDGPRYKALGNSMAVPCMAWIGRRIQMVQDGLL